MSQFKHLDVIADTVAKDLKCEHGQAVAMAIEGVAATARALKLPVSEKPTSGEIDALLAKHWRAFEEAAARAVPTDAHRA